MSSEASLQAKLIKFLKSRDCYIIKTQPGPGVPVGCPDIIFLYRGFWGGLEVKKSESAAYQPLQKLTIEKLHKMSWCKAVYPENIDDIILELNILLA